MANAYAGLWDIPLFPGGGGAWEQDPVSPAMDRRRRPDGSWEYRPTTPDFSDVKSGNAPTLRDVASGKVSYPRSPDLEFSTVKPPPQPRPEEVTNPVIEKMRQNLPQTAEQLDTIESVLGPLTDQNRIHVIDSLQRGYSPGWVLQGLKQIRSGAGLDHEHVPQTPEQRPRVPSMSRPLGLLGAAEPPPENPYAALWTDDLLHSLPFDVEERARREKREQMAEARAHGDLGTVPTPDTSAGAVIRDTLGVAGATAANANVGVADMPRLPMLAAEEALHRASRTFNPPEQRLSMPLSDIAPQRSAVPDPLGPAAEMSQGWQDEATRRLSESSADLPTPIAGGLFWGATTAGMMADASQYVGGHAQPFGTAAQGGAEVAGRRVADLTERTITSREVEAAVQRGVEPVSPGFGTGHDAVAYGAWLDRAGIPARDGVHPGLQGKFFELHHPDLPELPELAKPRPLDVPGSPGISADLQGLAPEPTPAAAAPQALSGGRGPVSPRESLARLGSPTLYRESSPDHLLNLLSSDSSYMREVPMAQAPELALGQGRNRGVVAEFDATKIGGAPNAAKPGMEPLLAAGRGEVVARGNGSKRYLDALQRVTVDQGAVTDRYQWLSLKRLAAGLKAKGWVVTPGEEGRLVFEKPPANPAGNIQEPFISPATGEAGFIRNPGAEVVDRPDQLTPPLKGPLQPQGAEAGFMRNPWAPEPDLYKQTYDLRHRFVTEQNVAVRQSAVRAKALQGAIPDGTVREDMTAVFHGTGNPLIKGDTPQAAAARLAASPHAQEADQAIAAWRQRSDELWTMAKDAGADDLGYFKNYLHMVYETPKGEQAIRGSAFSEGPTTSVMRERAFENPSEAMARGYKPKSLDFSVLMHETERAHAHTRAILGLMDDIGAVNEKVAENALKVGPIRPEDLPSTPIIRAAVNPNPAQYVRVEGFPILDRAAPGRVDPEAVQMAKKLAAEAGQANAAATAQRTIQPSLPGLESFAQQPMTAPGIPETPPNIYVHKDVWRNLMPVLKSDDPVALDGLLSTVKRVNFLGSLFHGLSLTEAAIKDMGPLRGTYEAGRRGFGIPGLSQMAAKLGGGKIAEESVEAAIRDGVNVDMPKLDAMSDTFEGMLRDVEGKLRTGGNPLAPRNAMASALAGLRHTSAYYDEALWANYHAPLKVTAHELSLAHVAKKMGLTVADLPQDVRQSVASFTNDAFGGQNWQLLHNQLLSDPVAQRWMRRVFLSPDWNVSAIGTGISPFSSDPTRRMLGRNYWKNATALLAGYATLNYAISGHPMWENETGHKFDLETGMHDEKGRKIFFQVGKHARETPEFFLGRGHEPPIAGFLLRKLNSPLRGLLTATTGYSPGGFPGALADAKDDADKEARDLTKMEDLTARARDLGSGALPFVAQKLDAGEIARKLVIPFVQTKGMSLHEGRNELADAFREGDNARVREIRQWLHENGYTGEQINRAVSGAYRGVAVEKKRKLGETAAPMGAIDQPAATSNPYDGLW